MYVYICMYIYVCIYTYMHKFIYTYIHICMFRYTFIYICIGYAFIRACIRMYICMHEMYVNIYIYGYL